MQKISESALKRLVKEKGLTITRGKTPKPKKEPEKPEKSDLTPGIVVKSAEIVGSMAQELVAAADKTSQSSVMVAQIAQSMQKKMNEKPKEIAKAPKKRKWKFTPHRNYDNFIKYIEVEEL